MAQNFLLAAMTVLLESLAQQLSDFETQVLEELKKAAEQDTYWETLSRLQARVAAQMPTPEGEATYLDIVLENIAQKGRNAGLLAVLEQLKNDLGT